MITRARWFTHFFTAAIMAVVGFSAIAPAQAADKFQISDGVDSNFKEYLRDITSTNNGAFAVTPDGKNSFYTYCEDASFCQPVGLALKKCRQNYDQECLILAKGKDPKFDIEVITLVSRLDKSDPIMLRILKQDDLELAIVGNTLSGYYLNKSEWTEYYAPDGALYTGGSLLNFRYEIKNGKLCYDNEGTTNDWCAFISRGGDHLKYVSENGELLGEFVDTWVLAGQH